MERMTFASNDHRTGVANHRRWVTWRGWAASGSAVAGFFDLFAEVQARTEEEATALLKRRLGAVAHVERVNA